MTQLAFPALAYTSVRAGACHGWMTYTFLRLFLSQDRNFLLLPEYSRIPFYVLHSAAVLGKLCL